MKYKYKDEGIYNSDKVLAAAKKAVENIMKMQRDEFIELLKDSIHKTDADHGCYLNYEDNSLTYTDCVLDWGRNDGDLCEYLSDNIIKVKEDCPYWRKIE